jgi:hypothetical protein
MLYERDRRGGEKKGQGVYIEGPSIGREKEARREQRREEKGADAYVR